MKATHDAATSVNPGTGHRNNHDPASQVIDAPAGYPFPRNQDALMPWSEAATRLEQEHTYWLATVRADGRPHVAPLWGAWLDDAFYFQGAPTAHWARNLAVNPAASIHLESGAAVVIVEGAVDRLITDSALAARLVEVWRTKYGRMEPKADSEGIYRLRPHTARGWHAGFQNAARWVFSGIEGDDA